MATDRSNRDLKAGRHAAGRALEPAAGRADPTLAALQRALGNEQMLAQLAQGRADRGVMLAHILDRLSVVAELQSRELQLLHRGASFEWWRQVARDEDGDTGRPEPTRWHAAALAYDQALDALCRGDLAWGSQLLEKAMRVEDEVFSATTSLVTTEELEAETRPDLEVLEGLSNTGSVDPCDAPDQKALVDRILNIGVEPPLTPDLRGLRRPAWAEALEEEEEEEEEGVDDPGE